MTVEEPDIARAEQRCIMAALDHSKAASIRCGSDGWRIAVSDLVTYALRVRLGSHDDAQRS